MELVFVRAADLELIEFDAEALSEEPLRRLRESTAGAFVLIYEGWGQRPSYRIFNRDALIEFGERRWRGSGAEGFEELEGIFGFEKPPALIVARDTEPAEEAVVLAEGRGIGAWVKDPAERLLREPHLPVEEELDLSLDIPDSAEPPPAPSPPPLVFSGRGMRGGGPPGPRKEDLAELVGLEPEAMKLPIADRAIRRPRH